MILDGDDDESRAGIQCAGQGRQRLHLRQGAEEAQHQAVGGGAACIDVKGEDKSCLTNIVALTCSSLTQMGMDSSVWKSSKCFLKMQKGAEKTL